MYSWVARSWIQARSAREPFASRKAPVTARPSCHQCPVDDLRGKRLAEPLEQPVHDVEVVDHGAQVALGERAHGVGIAGADGLLDLLGLAAAGRIDQLARHVRAAHDLGAEVRLELWIVDDDADVAQRLRRVRQLREHALVRRVVALHRPDLHDTARAVASRDDLIGVAQA